jgi:hypothetical protein
MELQTKLLMEITTVVPEMLKLTAQKSILWRLTNMLGKPHYTSAVLPPKDITQTVTTGATISRYGSKTRLLTVQVLNTRSTV